LKCFLLSGHGIIDAATAVGVAGKPVIDLTREVDEAFGGIDIPFQKTPTEP
jgi:hypothetical protein